MLRSAATSRLNVPGVSVIKQASRVISASLLAFQRDADHARTYVVIRRKHFIGDAEIGKNQFPDHEHKQFDDPAKPDRIVGGTDHPAGKEKHE
jgi:hypothetical protein